FAEAPVGTSVGRRIAQHVVTGVFRLDFLESLAKIVGVVESPAPRILRQRGQGFPAAVHRGNLGRRRRTTVRGRTGRTCRSCVAAGRQRHQAARIHGVERDVRLVGGRDGGQQLRLVFYPGAGDAAGKVNDGLPPWNPAQHLRQGFDGGELFVGV